MARAKKKERVVFEHDGLTAIEPSHPLARLYDAVSARNEFPMPGSRTAKLLAAGIAKMAQKVVEEAAEVAIEAVRGQRQSVINETADLFYNLTVLLTKQGIPLSDVWAEMERREKLYGIAEKLPKAPTPDDESSGS